MRNGLLASLSGEPILIAPDRVAQFKLCIEAIEAFEEPEFSAGPRSSNDFWSECPWLRPYEVVDGILTIPVKGALVNGFPYQYGSYATGYEYVQAAYDRGMDDKAVKAIALDIDSPGGMVAGNFDLVDAMFARRGEKPVRAFANASAYSAAYNIASVADSIVVNRTGGVGSIGVVTMHIDYSKALENEGVKITYIYAGKHKIDGNPYQELKSDVKDRIQARVDALYSVFVSTVARNRGLDETVVRGTEALTYGPEEAIKIGLADAVGSFAEAVAAFERELTGDNNMSDKSEKADVISQVDLDTARKEGVSEGAKAERGRISAIIKLDEAASRRDASINIALNTSLSVEEAKSLLGVLPEDKAETKDKGDDAQANAFVQAMAHDNPEIGADGGDKKAASDVDSFFASAGIPALK